MNVISESGHDVYNDTQHRSDFTQNHDIISELGRELSISSIFDACDMPTGDVHSSKHLAQSYLELASALLVETYPFLNPCVDVSSLSTANISRYSLDISSL